LIFSRRKYSYYYIQCDTVQFYRLLSMFSKTYYFTICMHLAQAAVDSFKPS